MSRLSRIRTSRQKPLSRKRRRELLSLPRPDVVYVVRCGPYTEIVSSVSHVRTVVPSRYLTAK